jgi:hypothetical protein
MRAEIYHSCQIENLRMLSLLEGAIAMKILVACESSGRVRQAFRDLGHDAWSCDLDRAEDYQKYHLQEDVMTAIHWQDWDMMIAFPPCTYLSRAGSRWLYPKGVLCPNRYAMLEDAREFFFELLNADIPLIAIENPTPVKIAKLPEPSQVIQPYHFGDPYTKRTLLWLKGLQPLVHTNVVEPIGPWVQSNTSGKGRGESYHPGFAKSAKDRSRTFQGIADAMAAQWSNPMTLERWMS